MKKNISHHLSYLLSCLIVLPALTGCLGEPEVETEVLITEALAFEAIGHGQRAMLDTTEVAIRDAETWATYQEQLQPLQPFEEVDFSREMVVLAALPVPTGGYGIEIDVVEKTPDSLIVGYLLSTPGSDCIATLGQGVVFQAVRVAQAEGALRFERSEEAYRCSPRR